MGPADTLQDLTELKKSVLTKECVVFVGAGLSKPPGKDWKGLVRSIAIRCEVERKEDDAEPEIIDKCIDKNVVMCNQALKEEFPQHSVMVRTALVDLHRLPFKALLTTNFDPWIQQQSRVEKYKRWHVYPDLPIVGGISQGLYYLHGYLDYINAEPNIRQLVFGKKSFQNAYADSLLPGFLLNVFVYENVLFIGFNPTETNIANLLSKSMDIRRMLAARFGKPISALPKRYVLWPAPNGKTEEDRVREEMEISRLGSLEVIPILFDRVDDDYKGIEIILKSWIAEGPQEDRPTPFSTGFKL